MRKRQAQQPRMFPDRSVARRCLPHGLSAVSGLRNIFAIMALSIASDSGRYLFQASCCRRFINSAGNAEISAASGLKRSGHASGASAYQNAGSPVVLRFSFMQRTAVQRRLPYNEDSPPSTTCGQPDAAPAAVEPEQTAFMAVANISPHRFYAG